MLLNTNLYFFLHVLKGRYLTEVTVGKGKAKVGNGSGGPGGLRGVHCLLETHSAISGLALVGKHIYIIKGQSLQ